MPEATQPDAGHWDSGLHSASPLQLESVSESIIDHTWDSSSSLCLGYRNSVLLRLLPRSCPVGQNEEWEVWRRVGALSPSELPTPFSPIASLSIPSGNTPDCKDLAIEKRLVA